MAWKKQVAEAAKHLRENDPVLAPIIDTSGPVKIEPHNDYYRALAGSIIGQQLSVKAAATIRDRFAKLGKKGFPEPEEVTVVSDEKMREAGLSAAKVRYVKDLAQHILEGKLRINDLPELPNEEIIVELTDVKGVGEWTAHMFLIFCLGRLDVLPTGDLGIRKGVQALYGLKDMPNPIELRKVADKNNWTGYESIASWYVWRSLDLDVVI